jgi:hypothetical protein
LLALLLPAASAPAQSPAAQRIVAVGDLHGDYDAWLDIARDARLIDARGRWIGGNSILVQLGDITDRGADSLKIIRSLPQLQRAAPRSGGRVVVILGNHEAMNLLGDLRYVTEDEFAAFASSGSRQRRAAAYDSLRQQIETAYRAREPNASAETIRQAWLKAIPLGWVEHRAAWKPEGELGRWIRGNPAIAEIGDTLFVHGGLSIEYSKLSLGEINRRTVVALAAADDSDKSILNDPLGPLWYRGLLGRDREAEAARSASGLKPTPQQELDAALKAFGAKRIVVGHTPNLKGITITEGGRLVRVDTGISRYYGGALSWLEIVGDQLTPHEVRRSKP